MDEAPISFALGRQSALAEAHGLYRMIQPVCGPVKRREAPLESTWTISAFTRLEDVYFCQSGKVEEGEGERVGEVQAHSPTLSSDHRNGAMKSYGFGFLPSAEAAMGLGFQKSGSALIHSSCT
jgi:hypothetical protein